MSDEQDKLKLSLEPPKLFGRKKKTPAPADASEAEPTTPAPKTKAAADPTPKAEEELVVEPAPEPEPEPEPAPEPEPVEIDDEPTEVIVVQDAVVEDDVVEDDVVEDDVTEAAVIQETAPAETSVPEEPAARAPATETDATSATVIEPTTAPEPDLTADPDPEPTAPLPSADRTTKTRTPKIPKLIWAPKKQVSTAPATDSALADPALADPALADPALADPELTDPDAEDAEIAAMAAQGPLLSAYRAAMLTGLVVGAAMVVLTWLSLRGCEAVRGTSSCGGGPGFLLLIATFAVCVLLGSALLRAFDIPDPGSSSFLAVGLVAVVALLFLISLLDHWSMIIIIPVLSIGAYLASVWVTKTFVEPVDP